MEVRRPVLGERNKFLFCAAPLRISRPGPQGAGAVAAARAAGGRIAPLGHGALLAGDAAGAVARVARDSGRTGGTGAG
jgi:hypothetical protein